MALSLQGLVLNTQMYESFSTSAYWLSTVGSGLRYCVQLAYWVRLRQYSQPLFERVVSKPADVISYLLLTSGWLTAIPELLWTTILNFFKLAMVWLLLLCFIERDEWSAVNIDLGISANSKKWALKMASCITIYKWGRSSGPLIVSLRSILCNLLGKSMLQ